MASALPKEVKDMFGGTGISKPVIGSERTSGLFSNKQAERYLKTLQRTYKKGEDDRNKIYLWFLKKQWGPSFLNMWFKLWNNKIIYGIRNSFERVTGFIRQQFNDIFGEFSPIIDLMKDSLIHVKDLVMGSFKFALTAGRMFKKITSKLLDDEGLKKFWTKITGGIKSLKDGIVNKLDKIHDYLKKAGLFMLAGKAFGGAGKMAKSLFTSTGMAKLLGFLLKGAVIMLLGGGLLKVIIASLPEELKGELSKLTGEIAKLLVSAIKGAWSAVKWIFGSLWPAVKKEIEKTWGPAGVMGLYIATIGLVGLKILKMARGAQQAATVIASSADLVTRILTSASKKQAATTVATTTATTGATVAGTATGVGIGAMLKKGAKFFGKASVVGLVIQAIFTLFEEAAGNDAELIAKAKGKEGAGLVERFQSFIAGLISNLLLGLVDKSTILNMMGAPGSAVTTGQAAAAQIPVKDFKDMPAISNEKMSSGNLGQQLNNPGNIKSNQKTGQAYIKAGLAEDSGRKAKDGSTFLKFKTPEAGWSAMNDALRGSFTGDTVDERMNRWSNKGYGAAGLGLGAMANKKMKDLSDEEMKDLMHKMATREGYYAESKGGAKLPSGGHGGGINVPGSLGGSGILAGLLAGGDPIAMAMFGRQIAEFENEVGLTRNEMGTKTNDTGQTSMNLQRQEALLAKEEMTSKAATNAMSDFVPTPVPTGTSSQITAGGSTGGVVGGPEPPPSLGANDIVQYILVNNGE